MKKVLIITYYWPPGGGSGVRRWLNFSNLLHDHDWKPVIFRPENADYPSTDGSLEKTIHKETEIIGSKITEPFQLYAKFIGSKKSANPGVLYTSEKPGFKEKLSVWIRSNLFIPDARMLWIPSAVKSLKKYLNDHPVDLIISTGPPHTTHIIAKKIATKFDVPWIADFRDPWTKIDFFHKLNLSSVARNKHIGLEKEVLKKSTLQTTVSWSWGKEFEELGAQHVRVVTNGFDPAAIPPPNDKLDDSFTITHLGSMNEDRNHSEFWRAIAELIEENEQFRKKIKIQLFGDIVGEVRNQIAAFKLQSFCKHVPFIAHNEAMKVLSTSRVLYLPLNNTPNVAGIVPGKIFEYLASKRPIFAIGPKGGDAAKILQIAENGIICNFGDFVAIKESIQQLFFDFVSGKDRVESDKYKDFSRASLVKDMVKYMNEAIDEKK